MSKKNKKRQIAKISVFITSIFVILFSVTYAFLSSTLTGEKQVVVNAGVLDLVLEEENEITISDALPMYDEVGMIQEDAFVFRLVNKTANDTNYILKLQEIETGTLDKSIVKYGLIKEGEKTIDFVSNITDGVIDKGIIKGNDTIDYELRLWIDSEVTSLTQVQSKFLSFRMTTDAKQEILKDPSSVEVKLFANENLGSNCKTYDDGVDTFLVGQCSNNYVWYSGKLWRVVLKNNETGAVKMVTDNSITAIPYNESNNAIFENSYMDQWLNQEFLPTLHDYSDYLVVDNVWDVTSVNSFTPSRPTDLKTINRTVGLLNAYEYYVSYGQSDGLATQLTGYLHNEMFWWLITPYNGTTYLIGVNTNNTGNMFDTSPSTAYSVRPSVNLQPTVQIDSGNGSETNPYILTADIREAVAGTTLLSTRYSGEYVTFDNDLYRIVGVENGLTKITAVNRPSSLLSHRQFHSQSNVTNFAEADIKITLENYYQRLKTTNEVAYNMIEPNTTWYLGTVGNGVNYKASVCATIDITKSINDCTEKTTSTTASIALPRAGEMFTSQITREERTGFWTLTPHSTSYVSEVNTSGYVMGSVSNPSSYGGVMGIHPSMYLKQNVVIASSNTGNGTYEKPYQIELGA